MTDVRIPDRSWAQLSGSGSLAAVVLGVLALLGWVSGLEFLSTFGTGLIPMAPSTAILFILFGVLTRGPHPEGRARRVAVLAVSAGTAAALLLLITSSLGVTSSIEHLGLGIRGTAAGAPVGHMSPFTALAFVLAGLSLLAELGVPVGRESPRAAFFMAVILEILAAVLTSAYFMSQPLLYDTGIIPPALTTSLGLLGLGLGLVGRSARSIWPDENAADSSRPGIVLVSSLFVAGAAIITPSILLFDRYQDDVRTEVEEQLGAIADLKVSQIEYWRRERRTDAMTLASSPVFARLMERAQANAADGEAWTDLRQWLESFAVTTSSPRVSAHAPDGTTLVSVAPGDTALDLSHDPADIRRVIADGTVQFRGFHRDSPTGPVHMTLLAPVFSDDGLAVGAVAIRVDPGLHLFPVLQRWPTPSRTAETLIVRRDGDDVLFLSPLRFRDDPPATFRLSLADSSLPASVAVMGSEGIVEGQDYRGESVIAAVRIIQDSPWRLVARIDRAEALAPVQARMRSTILLVAFLLLGVTTAVGFGWQRREKLHLRSLLEARKRESAVLSSVGEAVIATDADGRVTLMNPVAEQLTGWTFDEAEGRPLDAVVRIEDEATGEVVPDPVATILAGDEPVDLASSAVLVSRDGTRRPIAESGARVRTDGSRPGAVLVFRDQTGERAARRALEAREEKYRSLFNSIRDAIIVANTERQVIDCNPAFTELFGYSLDDLAGEETRVIYADQAEFEAMATVLRSDGPAGVRTLGFRRKDGTVFTGETTVFPLRDGDGRTIGFIGLVRDISEKERVAMALARSERRYRTLYEAAPVGIFRTRSDGQALSVNGAMASILGFDSEENAVRHYTDLGHQLYTDASRRDEFLEQLREVGYVEDFEYQARRPDGAVIWIEMDARVSRHFPDGTFEIEGFASDISDRKRAMLELERHRTMLERTERSARIGSWELDVINGQVTWSTELYRIFGLDPDDGAPPLGQSGKLFPPEEAERLRAAVDRAIQEAEPYDLEIRALRADGEVRVCRARGYPEEGPSGDVVRLFGSFADITEQAQREQRERELQAQLAQAQKMESVGRLAGGVAHDFNNMLSVILGHAELALERIDPDEELHSELRAIYSAADRSAELTRQLLAFAREQIVAPELMDLNETVESMLKMLKRIIGEDVELAWEPAESVWPVMIDPVQVDQILVNLLVNARDAIDGVGAVTIRTECTSLDEAYVDANPDASPGDHVRLVVTDTGCGMPKDVADRIFEPFFSTKPEGEGTGLGLSTVYGIVRQNDGHINVYSEPGHGTTFRIYLPRAEGASAAPGPRELASASVGGDETVLVVEDQPALLGLARKILHGLGYSVLTADGPEEALEVARDHPDPIDLLLTDVVMPGMNGRELAERIAEAQSDLRVLFMSGYPADVIADRGVIRDGVRFLEKPFTVAELSRQVRSVLDADEGPDWS